MEENKGQILLYQTVDGESRIEVTLCNDTVWLTLDQMAELFLIKYLQLIIPQYFISNKSGIWSLSLIVHSKG